MWQSAHPSAKVTNIFNSTSWLTFVLQLLTLLSEYRLQEEIFTLNFQRILVFWRYWINWKDIAGCSLAIHPLPWPLRSGCRGSPSLQGVGTGSSARSQRVTGFAWGYLPSLQRPNLGDLDILAIVSSLWWKLPCKEILNCMKIAVGSTGHSHNGYRLANIVIICKICFTKEKTFAFPNSVFVLAMFSSL